MPEYNVTDTLKLLHETKGRDAKKKILQDRECFALKALLQLNFHPDVKWMIPRGVPPYEPAKEGTAQSNSLHYEVKKLDYYINPSNNLPQLKREAMFVNLLERIEPDDAQLLLDIKDKKLNRMGLTYGLVREVWPDLLPEIDAAEAEKQYTEPVEEKPKPAKKKAAAKTAETENQSA